MQNWKKESLHEINSFEDKNVTLDPLMHLKFHFWTKFWTLSSKNKREFRGKADLDSLDGIINNMKKFKITI